MLKQLLAVVAICAPVATFASTVTPISYTYISAPNGGSAYRDDSYNGTTGQLTDGVSANSDWQATDGFNRPGPNVGWSLINPVIQFDFDQDYDFSNLVMNFQDGQGIAGVGIPDSVTVNGVTSPMLTGGNTVGALNATVDLSSLTPTDQLTVTVNRGFQWTFLSEFTFSTAAPAVPVPAGLPLLLTGLGAFAWLRRRNA